MSLWGIAWAYLWDRKFTTVLTILSVGLAVALISSVLTLRRETEQRFEEEGQAFDVVVGAKGSPLQLVLSAVYFLDQPTGNIDYHLYEEIRDDDRYVKQAYPLGMGDTYQGFKIIGTTPGLLEHEWVSPVTGDVRRPFDLARGEPFEKPYEAVLGALAARRTGLEPGDTFISTHGSIELPKELQEVDHAEDPYTVVGVLAPSNTPFDRGIFCSLETVHVAHAHAGEHDEGTHEALHREAESMVTAVLVELDSPALRFQYTELIRETTNAMAAIPINQIRDFFNQALAPAKAVLLAVGYLVVVISALSILIGLYLSIVQRRRDLAVMRALGASAYEIFGAVVIEAFWVTVLGIGFGWLLGSAVTYGLGQYLAGQYGFVITAFGLSREHVNAFAAIALVGLLAGFLPAWQAYDTDVAADLAGR